MASEIKRTTTLTRTINGITMGVTVAETFDQAGTNAMQNVQIIGATSEAITVGDVTGKAYLAFVNMTRLWKDLTPAEKVATGAGTEAVYKTRNTVYLSTTSPATSGNALHKLPPGGAATMKTSATPVWYGIRDTNNIDLMVVAIEE